MEKKCFRCGEVKSLSEFYRHPRMADGHVNKCKDCNKMDVAKNRRKKIDYYREYDRKRGSRQTSERLKKYRAENPGKYKAQNAVNNALRDGRMAKPSGCEQCGSDFALHGHHDDYSKPLEVRWLCAACHHQWHAEHGEAKNGRAMV